MNNTLIYFLFPFLFMRHKFEEIIIIEKWMNKHRSDLYQRFPKISQRFNKLTDIDTRNFSIIVAEEFSHIVPLCSPVSTDRYVGTP